MFATTEVHIIWIYAKNNDSWKLGRKAPWPPFSAFLWETWLMSHMWNTHGTHTTNLHSDSSYLNIFFRLPTLSTFSKYSHIQKYRTQDCGAGGRPIGSLTTIHTNIPTITITVLGMALWNVIRLLYVYAYIPLSSYMTKLLVILLQQQRSIQYESILKIVIPEIWAEKPPDPPLFCLFVRDLTHVTHVEYPWYPYYKSALRFLLSEYFL